MSLRHTREAWGLDHNPFPAAAIGGENSSDAPYDGDLLASDRAKFFEKLIAGAMLPPGREFGYLWSQGRRDDTGFGKTTLMLRSAMEINADLGNQIVSEYGLPENTTAAAVWASIKTTGVTGIYALLFNTIVDAAKRPTPVQPSLLEKAWERMREQAGIAPDDTASLAQRVEIELLAAHQELFPGYPNLRTDIIDSLVSCDRTTVLGALSQVSQASRARNGLAYFEAFYCLLQAADIQHLFVFIDQLEDLATARSVPRATRQREVGRFRDIFAETAGFRGHCHAVFTFHNRAAQALADFWHLERINPPFWPQDPMGRPATVVLRGLTSTTQVERVLATYLDSVRDVPSGAADPFDPSTFQVLLDRCEGRIGQLLPEAYAILEQASEEDLPAITGRFILDNLPGLTDTTTDTYRASDQDTLEALWNPRS